MRWFEVLSSTFIRCTASTKFRVFLNPCRVFRYRYFEVENPLMISAVICNDTKYLLHLVPLRTGPAHCTGTVKFKTAVLVLDRTSKFRSVWIPVLLIHVHVPEHSLNLGPEGSTAVPVAVHLT